MNGRNERLPRGGGGSRAAAHDHDLPRNKPRTTVALSMIKTLTQLS